MSKHQSAGATGWWSLRPPRLYICAMAVRSGATARGVKASSTRVLVDWSAPPSRPHAAASPVSGRRRVLICGRDAQSTSTLTTTARNFW